MVADAAEVEAQLRGLLKNAAAGQQMVSGKTAV